LDISAKGIQLFFGYQRIHLLFAVLAGIKEDTHLSAGGDKQVVPHEDNTHPPNFVRAPYGYRQPVGLGFRLSGHTISLSQYQKVPGVLPEKRGRPLNPRGIGKNPLQIPEPEPTKKTHRRRWAFWF
jgi:hypothetical protein